MKIPASMQQKIDEAREAKDASKLDLALRAAYHYECRGMSVSTVGHQYGEVLAIDPKFYG